MYLRNFTHQFLLYVDPEAAREDLLDRDGNNGKTLRVFSRPSRGANMGTALEMLCRSRHAKLPVVIPEGKTKLESALTAANLAGECDLAFTNFIPVFSHMDDKAHGRLPQLDNQTHLVKRGTGHGEPDEAT